MWIGETLQLTDNVISDLGVDEDAAYLFWTVVQAVRDYVFYGTSSRHSRSRYHALVRKWIVDPSYEVEWGESDDPPRFTFGEALEMLGIHSENVDVFRETIVGARNAKTNEEREKIVKTAYSQLHFHDNELEIWRCFDGVVQVSCF